MRIHFGWDALIVPFAVLPTSKSTISLAISRGMYPLSDHTAEPGGREARAAHACYPGDVARAIIARALGSAVSHNMRMKAE